jgi:hypothetical protein
MKQLSATFWSGGFTFFGGLKVKGQRQTVIMMVRETLSHHYTTTYQLSLTSLKRQKVIAQTQTHFKNINYLTLGQ